MSCWTYSQWIINLGWVTEICIVGSTVPAFAAPRAAVTQTNLVVTQFAVPVAVPQYVAPVAPQSYVQYGNSGSPYSTSSLNSLEDRIAAKVLDAIRAAGGIKALESSPTLVGRFCTRCHSGPATTPAKLDLSDLSKLSSDQRLKCVRMVLSDDENQRMPPKTSGLTLSPEDLGKLLQELSQSPKEVNP